jgi:hypothetical protein
MPTHLTPTTVCEQFFKPVLNLLPDCSTTRVCPALPDSAWLQLCLARVLHECPSGRAFLQEYGGRFRQCPEVGAFFESFKSQRRERLVQELNDRLQRQLAQSTQDRLADELVSTSQGVMVRQVTYHDPVSGETFRFLTKKLGVTS